MKFVVDTGALLSLSYSFQFKLLLREYALVITPGVKSELEQFSRYPDALGRKAQEILALQLKSIIPSAVLSLPLEKAECEVFSVASEKGYLALTDDVHAARVLWEKKKVICKPSFYLLLLFYQKKKLPKESLVADIKIILKYRNWLSGALWEYALQLLEDIK